LIILRLQPTNRTIRALLGLNAVALATLMVAAPAIYAQSSSAAEAEIRQALESWTATFNSGDSGKVCDLFASDLIANYQGQPERNYEGVCKLLRSSLQNTERKFQYSLQMNEILVFGDIAIVRLVWTLRVEQKNPPLTKVAVEPGLDVFRRQADGSWKIIRYMSYEQKS